MNTEQPLIDLIECPKTAACLECCGYRLLHDLINFNEDSIIKIESAISAFTRGIPLDKREIYLYPEYIEYPELFRIKPNIKSKILSVARQITSLCNQKPQIMTDHEYNFNGYDIHIAETPPKKPRTRTKKSKSDPKKPKVERKLIYDVSNMQLESEAMHHVVMRHANTKFFNCDLTMNRDFHIYKDPEDPKLGYFECLICKSCCGSTGELGNKAIIKYRYAQYGSLIFMNIQVHLEKHFSRVQPNKRRRLTKQERSKDANTNSQSLKRSHSESDISMNSEVVELVPKTAPNRVKQAKFVN